MKKIIRASKSAKAAKKKITANAVGNFYEGDFKRLLEEISDDIVAEWGDGADDIDDFIHEQLDYMIERECTYYADCINIIWGSHTTEWEDAEYPITSIAGLAGWILETYFYEDGYYQDVYDRLTNGDSEEEE